MTRTVKLIDSYKQGAIYLESSEKTELAELADNGIDFPEDFNLYRGIKTGNTHEIGDVVEVSDQNIESWSEDEEVASRFGNAVYELASAVKGIPVDDYITEDTDNELEWILSSGEYKVVEVSEEDEYILYTVERI
jgi:hypothetical protein